MSNSNDRLTKIVDCINDIEFILNDKDLFKNIIEKLNLK